MLVTLARVVTGIPIPPKAVGVVFAIRHIIAAKQGQIQVLPLYLQE